MRLGIAGNYVGDDLLRRERVRGALTGEQMADELRERFVDGREGGVARRACLDAAWLVLDRELQRLLGNRTRELWAAFVYSLHALEAIDQSGDQEPDTARSSSAGCSAP